MNTHELDPDLTVAEVLERWPKLATVLTRHHMACVGCCMAIFETLGDAARIYGLAPDCLITELDRSLESDQEAP